MDFKAIRIKAEDFLHTWLWNSHTKDLALIFMGMFISMLLFENHGLRKRMYAVEHQFDKFMSLKQDGQTLADKIKPGTFTVFIKGKNHIACAILNTKE